MTTSLSDDPVSDTSPAQIKPKTQTLSRHALLMAGAATAATSALGFPFIRNARAATLELRWLGWEHDNVKELTAAFEQEDVRDMLPDRYVEILFLNQTSAIKGLYQFDAPSSPEKWERIWSEVEAA
jgi:hypothetical protein